MSLDALIADMRLFARRGGRVALIDYLQLAVPQTYEDVTEASRRLKLAACSTGLLVVAVSQLSRRSTRDDGSLRPPSLSDLRQSGALEQDADTVMLLHVYDRKDAAVRDDMRGDGYLLEFDDGKKLGHVEFAKVRRGVPERIPAWFDGSEFRWTPVDRTTNGRPL
jgi:replicative DNA helicase